MLRLIKCSLIALSCLTALGLGSSAALADKATSRDPMATQAASFMPDGADVTGFGVQEAVVHGIIIHGPGCVPGPSATCIHGIIIHRHCIEWEIFGGERHCIRWARYL